MSRPSHRTLLVGLLALALGVAPLLLGDFSITLMNYIGVYTLIALGLVLLTGSGGLTSFGQAAFVGIGAYTTAWLTTAMGWSPWLGLVAALALTGFAAFIIGYATLHLGGHYLPITTIAWGVAIYLLFGSSDMLGRWGGIGNIPSLTFFGAELKRPSEIYYLVWLSVGLAMLGMTNLLSSREGRAIRSLRGGAILVESLGVNSFRIKLALFVLSAFLAAYAGWLFAHMQHFISPSTFDLRTGIEYLLMAVLGGSGHVAGALVGTLGVTLGKNWLQDLLPHVVADSGNLEIIVFGALFVLLLHFAPRGLAPYFARFVPAPAPPYIATGAKPAGDFTQRPQPLPGESVLSVRNATKRFGGLIAVDNVSFDVAAGTICALIGPNGAGKSTTFNLVTGVLAPSGGQVHLLGRDVTGMRSRDLAALGVARTFQHVKLRPAMTLLENVMMGAYGRTSNGFLSATLKLDRATEAALRALAMDKLEAVGLAAKAHDHAGNLPLGQQRILEIARALASDPLLLMLDEPAAGLRAFEKEALAALLGQLRARGMTIILVEHDMDFVMGLVDSIVVLNFGAKLSEGTPEQVRADPRVQEAYLGSEA